jgi:hypothetical protein
MSHFSMRVIRSMVVGLMSVGLIITSVGWYLSGSAGAEQRFESCHLDGDLLVLTYAYCANQAVEPRVDTRDGDVVVSLRTESGDGATPAVGLSGEASFLIFGGSTSVRYPDGEVLPCPRRE